MSREKGEHFLPLLYNHIICEVFINQGESKKNEISYSEDGLLPN